MSKPNPCKHCKRPVRVTQGNLGYCKKCIRLALQEQRRKDEDKIMKQDDRNVKVYTVFEFELRTISLMNTLMSASLGIGSGALSFALGLLANAYVQGTTSPDAKQALKVIVIICFVFAGLFLIAAGVAWKYADSEWHRIRKETKP